MKSRVWLVGLCTIAVMFPIEASAQRYDKAVAIGFAAIPSTDEGALSIAAVNRMIGSAIRGVRARETLRAKGRKPQRL